jgi:rhodanese-related sulfurtransferase
VVKLDTAYCNYSLRPSLLMTLRSHEMVLEKTGSVIGYRDPTDWLVWHIKRAVKASAITFTGNVQDVPPGVVASFIECVGGRHLLTVEFRHISGDSLSVFKALSLNCTSLRSLCIYSCNNITGIEDVIRGCSASLRSIAIDRSAFVSIDFTGVQLPSMRRLELAQMDGGDVANSVENLARCCGGLTEVVLTGMQVSDAYLAVLETHAESLVRVHLDVHNVDRLRMAALERLAPRCCNISELILWLTNRADAVLEAFVKAATQLRALFLDGDELTSAQLSIVATHCGNRLRRLHVGTGLALNAQHGFLDLAKHCTALGFLRCSCEAEHSDYGEFLQLVKAQKGLLSIDCSELHISDAYLATLADSCAKLQHIVLTGTTGYTVGGLMRLIDGCKCLRRVQVRVDDPVITEIARQMWVRINPAVKFVLTEEPQCTWL